MRGLLLAAMVLVMASASGAQDQATSPDELNRKYQDALTQLKAAQDRKNELATENEKLVARVAELEKQLDAAQVTAATLSQQTFSLRSHFVAWQTFMSSRPALAERWRLFMGYSPLAVPADWIELIDPIGSLPTP